MKKIISVIIAIATLLSAFTVPASAATSSTVYSNLRSKLPIVTYAMPSSGASKVYAYSNSSLSARQTQYYICSFSDQIVITEISSNGQACKVTYPSTSSSSGYRTKWFKTDDILGLSAVNVKSYTASSKVSTYRLKSASSTTSYGSISKNDSCISLGSHKVSGTTYYSVVYPISSTRVNGITVKYKLALSKSINSSSSSSSTTTSSSSYVWPCSTAYKVTCLYYYKTGAKHSTKWSYKNGIDIAGGGNIVAIKSGTAYTYNLGNSSFGKYIIIKHDDGTQSLYAHLSSFSVSNGTRVSQGQVIGVMGSSGNASGTHLHFEYSGGDLWNTYYRTAYMTKLSYESNVYSNNNKYNSDKTVVNWLSSHYTKKNGYYVYYK